MRIKLEKNRQKELIYSVKNQNNFTWSELAEYLNVKSLALKEWYSENCLLPLEIFEILNQEHNFDEFIIEIKDENWGQSVGGSISPGSTKIINKPQKSEELSELMGIILGDGNINVYTKGKTVATYALRICGHARYDFEYLTNFVSPLITKLFHIESKSYVSKSSKAFYVIANSKELINFLLDVGLKEGNKIDNQVDMPSWIRDNANFSRACLRGLIDTDGSIFKMSQRDSKLLRISFKNHSSKLLRDVRETFIRLGFHPSKIITGNTIFISRQKDIENYINTIDFHNPKHKERLKIIAP